MPLFLVKGHQPVIVKYKQIGFSKCRQQFQITSIPFSEAQVFKEFGHTQITGTEPLSACFFGEGTGEKGFTYTGG